MGVTAGRLGRPKGMFSRTAKLPFRRHCAWIYEVAGPEAVAEFCLRRLELGLVDDEASNDCVKRTIFQCHAAMARDLGDFLTLFNGLGKKAKVQKANDRHDRWEANKRRIIELDNQRRAGSAAIRRRLEQAHKKPSPNRSLTLQQRMAAGWERNRHLMEVTTCL